VRRGSLAAEATVLALTKRTAVVRIDVSNDGRLACIAQGTVLIVEQAATRPTSK
jgi:1,4-dihydroxy-2-naphthoyl-CoA hydrolase